MAPRRLPLVKDFTITGLPWTFRDVRRMQDSKAYLAKKLMVENAAEMSSLVGREDEVRACSDYEILDESPEICADPDRAGLLIAALSSLNRPVGAIGIDDMRLERDDESLIRAKARPSPGLPARGDWDQFKVTGRVMRWILANNLEFRNGYELDIVQWILPRGRKFRWTSKRRPQMLAMFNEIERDADRFSSDEDAESPIDYRRKGVPEE